MRGLRDMKFCSFQLRYAVFILIAISFTWYSLNKPYIVQNSLKSWFETSGGQNRDIFDEHIGDTIQETQHARQSVLGNTCENLKLERNIPESDLELATLLKTVNLFYSDKYKLISCLIPKAGTTNFKRFFLAAENFTEDTNPRRVKGLIVHKTANHKLRLSTLNGSEARYRINNYFKTILVRDPVIRILSAFRDRFENNEKLNPAGKLSREIHRRYDKSSTSTASLLEFVRYITDVGRKSNIHYEFYNTLCLPCVFKYDYILHLETLEGDWLEVMKQIGKEAYDIPQGRAYAVTTNEDKLAQYFHNKTDLLRLLYNAYQIDYKLFGYSAPKLL